MAWRSVWILAITGLLLTGGCVSHRIANSSPLRVRNQHPVQLTAIHADPRPARPPAAGKVESDVRVDWTSLWLLEGNGRDRVHLDGELIRTEFDFRVGLGHDLDVEVGLPVIHAGGGALDTFIEGWHRAWGFPQNGRTEYPEDRFDVGMQRQLPDGRLADAYRMKDGGLRLGDVPMFLTWFPYRSDSWSFGVRGGVEFPTGSQRDGYGNGGLDESLGFLGGYDGKGYSVFFGGSHSFVSTADRSESVGVSYGDVTSFSLGGQLALTEKLSALVQFEFDTSVMRNLDESHADKNQLLIWSGGRYRIAENMDLEFAIGEELILDVSPDVTFHLGLAIRF